MTYIQNQVNGNMMQPPQQNVVTQPVSYFPYVQQTGQSVMPPIIPQQTGQSVMPQCLGTVGAPYNPMQNNPTYIPIQQPNPAASSSGVNIVIYNPSVNPTAGSVANSNNSYNCAPVSYPPNYYMQPPQPPSSDMVAKSYLANTPIKEEVKTEKPKEETEKKEIVQLTDEYIRTLENYLNNPNVKIREMGVKELLERFKEHKSRYNDVALTNLLNKALQDGSKNVRFVAMSIIDAGYAQGDSLTFDLLQKMQSSKAVYGEDAMYASEILLKTAGNKVSVDVPVDKTKKKDEKGK